MFTTCFHGTSFINTYMQWVYEFSSVIHFNFIIIAHEGACMFTEGACKLHHSAEESIVMEHIIKTNT